MKNSKRYLFRLVIPAFPNHNIYSNTANRITALGAIMVATVANKLPQWDVEVIDENNYRRPGPKNRQGLPDHLALQDHRPADVVGFYGSLSSTIPRLYDLAVLYNNLGVKTVTGGFHVMNLPEEALAHQLDVVVFGDGEQTLVELLQAWSAGLPIRYVAGLAYLDASGQMVKTPKRLLLKDFAELPFPDFGLLRYARIQVYPISWYRGCPYKCEFCAVKDPPRGCSAEKFAEQIIHLHETRGAKKFFIVDDHFGGSINNEEQRQQVLEFCRLITAYQKKIGQRFNFTVQVRLNTARYPELLVAMREAGIRQICIGYESPIDEELTAMNKGYSTENMIEWTQVFKQHGFFIHGMFIFGYPYQEAAEKNSLQLTVKEKTQRFKDFIRRAKINTAQVLLAVPLPGTGLREKLIRDGRLLDLDWEYYDGQFPLFAPNDGSEPEELQQAVGEIMSEFYSFHHLWQLIIGAIVRFPLIVFPASLTLLTLRVKYLTASFRYWRREHWRDQAIKFAGHFIVRNWFKKFRQGDFLAQLETAKKRLNKNTPAT